jgi:hypothetical protein
MFLQRLLIKARAKLLFGGIYMVEVNTKKDETTTRKSFKMSKNVAVALDYVKSKANINERTDVDEFVKTEILNKYVEICPTEKGKIESLLNGGEQ